MLLLPTTMPDAAASARLRTWQAEIDAKPTYSERVDAAKAKFKQRNTRTNATFQKVKAALTAMCSGARRCVYCEDSVADEVEHIAPKDLYPEFVFVWDNYVYACGPCNGPKNNRYAVFGSNGSLIEVTRRSGGPVVPPISGRPGLINPRIDNPALLFDLDLIDTFVLLPKENLDATNRARADFTLDLLDLNRDVLLEARRTAYGSYRARLFEYRHKRDGGAGAVELDTLIKGLKAMPHPTVFAEMQRSHLDVPELTVLFGTIPEALQW
ncbi:hypothetical protein MesoLjLc_39130 [Mesorhizobium sp. L-8-10]|uniref:hypothetical protein n=1 Tax=unclassified Mesorhizobium TaxID=325217 RepID=UPI0019262CC5|nr:MULTISPECIES: hypothetical protein [unclassified Mesorhizobium]BCH24248.1 hypothetical protein MesoLjLb_40330 [Mesorhizobium sp. L-8-3]BCH31983.1 hypothetical protein MesoLjLc_39130 [Mesorhizobium sp. L-8-10]